MTLRLQLMNSTPIPLEVEGILPEAVCGKSLAAIEQLPIFHGNRQVPLAEFFRVLGSPDSDSMVWEGDLTGVHWIGAGMTRGILRIEGPAGRHVGSRMRGGRIDAVGPVSDWLGAEMLGGVIQAHADAGHMVGAAYRGSARGMTGGTILVSGSAGNEIGHSMRRGLIAIGGDAADLLGFGLLAGTILVYGNCGIRLGAGMRRGTIGVLGPQRPTLLPSFRSGCRCRLEILRIMERLLSRHKFPATLALGDVEVDLFHGDLLEGGRGEVLMRAA